MVLFQPEQFPTADGDPPPLPPRAADTHGRRAGALWFTACAWCRRVKVRGQWLPAERARAVIDVTNGREPRLTHGICPSCFVRVSARADRERRRGHEAA